ncbi:MAG: BON domain-containing protein [Candidatus Dormibacter sp.]
MKIPEIKMPELKRPDVRIASKLPTIKLSNMKLPRVSIESAQAARQAQKRLRARRGGPNPVSILAGAIGGAALFYFLDPQRGAGRRAQAKDQILATIRRVNDNLGQLGSRAGANANGFSRKMVHLRSAGASVDDLTLRDRVESEIFRDPNLPKGRLNLDVESAVVTVRGEVDNALQIASIEKAVLKVRGVNGVENLMHVQGTPAPNKVESRESVR